MALLKQMDTPYGDNVKANYHRVVLVSLDMNTKALNIQTSGYSDQQAREEGKAPLGGMPIAFQDADFDEQLASEIIEKIYLLLKTKPVFADAQDC